MAVFVGYDFVNRTGERTFIRNGALQWETLVFLRVFAMNKIDLEKCARQSPDKLEGLIGSVCGCVSLFLSYVNINDHHFFCLILFLFLGGM